jgi:hypothetical protein
MGSGGTYTRPEEQQWGGGGSVIFCIDGERNLGVVEAGGEVRGGVRVRNIGLTDRLSASDRVCYKGRPGPVERRSEVKGRRREWVEGVVVRGS